MKKSHTHLCIIIQLLFLSTSNISVAKNLIDSLEKVIESNGHDTTKAGALGDLAWELQYSNPDTAYILTLQALKLYQKLGDEIGIATTYGTMGGIKCNISDYDSALFYHNLSFEIRKKENDLKGIASSYGNIGNVYYYQSDYNTAIEYYRKSIAIKEQLGDSSTIAAIYNNIGILYANQADYKNALESHFRSLEISNQLKDRRSMADSHNNIGIIYDDQSDYPKALDHFLKALKIYEGSGDVTPALANCFNNIGVVYNKQKNYSSALEYYEKSLKIHEKMGDKKGIAYGYNNIGIIYNEQADHTSDSKVRLKNYPKALEYFRSALNILKEIGNIEGVTHSYTNLGSFYTSLYEMDSTELLSLRNIAGSNQEALLDSVLYYHQKALELQIEMSAEYGMTYSLSGIALILARKGDYRNALPYYLKTAHLADSIGVLQRAGEAHQGIAMCYEMTGKYHEALDHYKLYVSLKDSIFNEEKSKDLGRLEARHEFEMAEMKRKAEAEAEAKSAAEAMNRRNILQYSIITIGIVLVFMFILAAGRFNISHRLVEGITFLAFLLFFEFTLVLLDPYIEQFSGGEPAYKLLFNAVLAGLIFPLHSFFESKLKDKLTQSNEF